MRIAAFTKYDREAASTRQRVLQYSRHLTEAGISLSHYPLLSNEYVRALASGETYPRLAILKSYWRRFFQLRQCEDHDLILVQAELFPYLPGAVEKVVFRSGKPVIYDWDDAFFHNYDQLGSGLVRKLLAGKFGPLLQRSNACLCGNEYVRSFASQFNDNSLIFPTVVDTALYQPRHRDAGRPLTIGWIGSPSTWAYVQPLLPLLGRVAGEHGARLLAVGPGRAAVGDKVANLEVREWSEESEVADVQEMDIGIMPLTNEPWARGKSGYKLIQYMACGVPVIASPVGANLSIVRHDIDGFLARTEDAWETALTKLLLDAELRSRMGAAARLRVIECYSLDSQAPRLVQVLTDAMSRDG